MRLDQRAAGLGQFAVAIDQFFLQPDQLVFVFALASFLYIDRRWWTSFT